MSADLTNAVWNIDIALLRVHLFKSTIFTVQIHWREPSWFGCVYEQHKCQWKHSAENLLHHSCFSAALWFSVLMTDPPAVRAAALLSTLLLTLQSRRVTLCVCSRLRKPSRTWMRRLMMNEETQRRTPPVFDTGSCSLLITSQHVNTAVYPCGDVIRSIWVWAL